jgi:hypothetical protein
VSIKISIGIVGIIVGTDTEKFYPFGTKVFIKIRINSNTRLISTKICHPFVDLSIRTIGVDIA